MRPVDTDPMVSSTSRVRQSAIEQGPALLIAQPLVVEHEVADLAWELCALPSAL
jgi:hypothetical protein